ncbi:hypothetical protein DM02DRAFT_512187 [Periconia macrospinosa]|uniref:UBA domain-containing protein n=1 Tax=Periconia macrospinosa TaxID=97972 RepID=A0A2V1EC06_9PLEO|nr:hypothetical protein DM02DRAFT_512187 [Periconia macrospinosa]
MSTTVDNETLSSFMGVLDGTVTRDQAIHILKLSNNNLETAIDKYFTAGGAEGLQSLLDQPVGNVWDNNAFGADRYGQNDANSTFNIDYAPGYEHYPHSGGPSGAPTRPSSRTSHRSNVSTHAGDAPRQSVETGQESGVIGSTFGPANQDTYYDNAAWAMVPISQSAEYVPDASLWYQSRNSNEPAILKPSTGPQYLPALLTILHSIPLYRNALLSPNIQIDNYWSGSEWWKGNSEAQPRMIDGDAHFASSGELDLIYETQRLMAFLDDTERSYASLETLFKLDAWTQTNITSDEPPNDDLVKFLLRWSQLYKQHHPDAELDGVFRSTINIGNSVQRSFVLDVDVPPVPSIAYNDRHLYDVLDGALFDSDVQSAHIKDASDVLIFRLTSTGDHLDCVIPPVLYADRYLEETKPFVEKMFAQKRQHEEDMIRVDDQIDKLKFHRPNKPDLPTKMIALDMIKASMGAFDPEVAGHQDDANDAAVLAQLKSLYDKVERKLADLEDEKQKACDALKEVSDSFRVPIEQVRQTEDSESLHGNKNTYKLQGVATSSTDYYVLHPKSIESENSSSPQERQWWYVKYDYTNGDDATIIRQEVNIETVCVDASANSGKVLLVYANDAALSLDNIALPTPLQDFVKADNAVLVEEFERNNNTWATTNEPENWVMNDGDGDPPDYDWNSVTATEYHQLNDHKNSANKTGGGGGDADSTMSSTTLTPNTDIDDDLQVVGSDLSSGMQEMKEAKSGITAWAGRTSNASSETVGIEPLKFPEGVGGKAKEGKAAPAPKEKSAGVDGGGVEVPPQMQQGEGKNAVAGGGDGDGDVVMRDVSESFEEKKKKDEAPSPPAPVEERKGG